MSNMNLISSKKGKTMVKKSKISFLIVLSLVLLLSACGGGSSQSGSTASGKTTIKLGLVCGALNPLLALVPLDDGSFEKAGLNVEKNCFSAGADAVQALIGGSIDINLGSYEHVLRQRSNGLDVKAYAGLYNGIGYTLVTKKSATYQKIGDLKNATLGVTKSGSLSDTGLRMILDGAGLNPDRDVKIIAGGSGATMLAALESNQVAAGMITEPTVSQMIKSGNYRVLVDPTNPYVGLVAMAKPEWVNKNKEAMKTFLKVLKEVHQRTGKDPAGAAKALAKEFEQVPQDVLAAGIASELKKMPADLKVDKAGADGVVASQIDLGAISKKVPFEDTIDLSYLP
jgi:ABC-type nitrate/sulfonate/bicarbonate transport system substrate-binding protein